MVNQHNKPVRVLMVCLGNICRSPLAEGIFRETARLAGLSCIVDSAGTSGWHAGEPPHHLSQKVARLNNIDISMQKGRAFIAEDFLRFDRIFFMDTDNWREAEIIAGKLWDPSKASLLLEHLPESSFVEVPDPYYGGFVGFIEVFNLIQLACKQIVESLKHFEQAN